ncbi:gamma-secretase subunit PEN-2-like [Centruroides sculpturatus]|uniref:gamma-secretase subunit PEN-2-like n=1 Tax=Centruroides sculpturatus TaxID=218467 RepID=UPI000C6E0B83|nr:gamma-secretase subunit PEN-2-like [Centruroides sculpturatus]
MDLRKMKNDDKLKLCRGYYIGGYFMLPFLWFVNFVWFFGEAFRKPAFEEQKQIRTYVLRSGIGALVWAAALLAWIVVFQVNRADWGETADKISFIIPTGIP